ncbi:oligosaccharide flippase family protein [Vogesella sp. DC21W]|uniref:Oligosaccharide flippase family protein n=1 Tax=Vogesella aquatica TaxID=2984206 RepID=A0ABT5IWM5_9NEIS|nr:oligosaccharide flippase family protein [Vogesella aquatica]MDC7716938.1 oligosaccharide flippase family protein [Vogesella aquatica]
MNNLIRIVNIGLRAITLAVRFLFIFLLAKYLDPTEVGYYGIFTATVGYAMYFFGLDFYTYVSREILKVPPSRRGQLLKGQVALSVLLYIALAPFALWFLSKNNWPSSLIYWFFPIVVLEHFNQEISRLLITLSEQLISSVILFIRQGSWAIVIIVLMRMESDMRNLDVVMAAWAMAGSIAAGTGIWKLKQLKTEGWHLPIDWRWVKNGIGVSIVFLIATLALRGVQTFDRYWLEALGGIKMVGAYVLLISIAGTLLTFLDAAVFAFSYPDLIRLHHERKYDELKNQIRILFWQTAGLSIMFGIISWLVLPYLLSWIGNPLYLKAVSWYPWLLLAMIVNAIGMVPHYALYACDVDKPIIYSHLAALIIFVLVIAIFSHWLGYQAVFFGINAAFACIFIWKAVSYFRLLQQWEFS